MRKASLPMKIHHPNKSIRKAQNKSFNPSE